MINLTASFKQLVLQLLKIEKYSSLISLQFLNVIIFNPSIYV